jgi:hypothetical protein
MHTIDKRYRCRCSCWWYIIYNEFVVNIQLRSKLNSNGYHVVDFITELFFPDQFENCSVHPHLEKHCFDKKFSEIIVRAGKRTKHTADFSGKSGGSPI